MHQHSSCPKDKTDWFALNLVRAVSDFTVSTGRTIRAERQFLDAELCMTLDESVGQVFQDDHKALATWRDRIKNVDKNRQLAIMTRGTEPLPLNDRYFCEAEAHKRRITIGLPPSQVGAFSSMLAPSSHVAFSSSDVNLRIVGLEAPGGIAGMVSQLASDLNSSGIIGIEAGPASIMDSSTGLFARDFPCHIKRTMLITTFHGDIDESVHTFDPPVKIPVQDYQELVSFGWHSPLGCWDLRLLDEK